MHVSDWLAHSQRRLHAVDTPSARLDCLILLEDALGRNRASILAHPEAKISKTTELELNKKIAQRATHTPLAYIRGKTEFYGREFIVNSKVLVPRPETETIISILKKLPLPTKPKIADIGTGSGCLGITAALEIPGSFVDLYDIDTNALAVAKKNAAKQAVDAQYYQNDLLEKYQGQHDAMLANLPYVPQNYTVNEAARHEPVLALYSGTDGLDHYRRFWKQIAALPDDSKPAFILTEALPLQHEELARLARKAGYHLEQNDGLIQQFQY